MNVYHHKFTDNVCFFLKFKLLIVCSHWHLLTTHSFIGTGEFVNMWCGIYKKEFDKNDKRYFHVNESNVEQVRKSHDDNMKMQPSSLQGI